MVVIATQTHDCLYEMTRITPDLVRKRAEHNDMELSTLEELSLHQMDIEKIEHLHRWCPRLKILLLQGNLISKIENMNRFRELEYLNLALNNIESIEGLQRCEALTKLDLTANFVIYLTSLTTLVELSNLKELYLTGNPCTEFKGYRPWVVNHLVQLQELDGTEIFRSERIKSLQRFQESNTSVEKDQSVAIENRNFQKRKYEEGKNGEEFSGEEDFERWNNELTDNCPEVRIEMHKEIQKRRERSEGRDLSNRKEEKPIKYFTSQGEPLNLNRANLEFHFQEDEVENVYILEVKTYKYLDSSHLTCDVQPKYVRVTCKSKPLQIVFPSEVKPDQSTAKRSAVTGHLIVTAPRVEECQIIRFVATKKAAKEPEQVCEKNNNYLEFDKPFEEKLKVIPEKKCATKPGMLKPYKLSSLARPDSPGFEDDPDVPPLL